MGVMAVTMRRLVEHVSRMFESETEAGELGVDEDDEGHAMKGDPEGLLMLEKSAGDGPRTVPPPLALDTDALPMDLISETEICLTRAKEAIVRACKDGKETGEAYSLYHEAWHCYVSSRYNKANHLCFRVQRMLAAS